MSIFTNAARLPSVAIITALMAVSPAFSQAASLPEPAYSFKGGFNDAFGIGGKTAPADAKAEVKTTLLEVIKTLLFFVSILAIAAIIVGGVLYIVSFGNDQKAASAKKIILYAIIGLIVIMLASVITNFVINLTQGGTTSSSEPSSGLPTTP